MVGGAYEASARAFTPNPAAFIPFHVGLALGVLAGSPLLLISWPLAAALGPGGSESEGLASRLAPALALGLVVGDLLALPFWPFGLPFEPDDLEPEAGPERPLASAPGDG